MDSMARDEWSEASFLCSGLQGLARGLMVERRPNRLKAGIIQPDSYRPLAVMRQAFFYSALYSLRLMGR